MRGTSEPPPCTPQKLKPLEVPPQSLKNREPFLSLHLETPQLRRQRTQHLSKPVTDRLREREPECLLRNSRQHQTGHSLHKSVASPPLELPRENPAFSEKRSITPLLTGGLAQPFPPRRLFQRGPVLVAPG